jgi:hypothetical protein
VSLVCLLDNDDAYITTMSMSAPPDYTSSQGIARPRGDIQWHNSALQGVFAHRHTAAAL